MSATIKKLSSEAIKGLRTGVTAPSFVQIVEELAVNAVDAGATHVEVAINFNQFQIEVSDNGHGICINDLPLIGKRYCTSKCQSISNLNNDVSTYGFRGEALASLRDVGDFVITTRCSHCGPEGVTYYKEMNARAVKQMCPATIRRSSHGTTVSVRNIFQRLPVRRKALIPRLEMDAILWRLRRIALINPDTSFELTNASIGTRILKTQRAQSVAAIFGQLFGEDKACNLLPIILPENGSLHAQSRFAVHGYIGMKGHNSANLQFVYVNGRFVCKSPIHKLLSRLLAQYVYDRSARDECKRDRIGRRPLLHGVYCVNISCAPQEYDICFEPGKTLIEFKEWTALLKVIERDVLALVTNECADSVVTPQSQAQPKFTDKCVHSPPANTKYFNRENVSTDHFFTKLSLPNTPTTAPDLETSHVENEKIAKDLSHSPKKMSDYTFQYTAPRRGGLESQTVSSARHRNGFAAKKTKNILLKASVPSLRSRLPKPRFNITTETKRDSMSQSATDMQERSVNLPVTCSFNSRNAVEQRGLENENVESDTVDGLGGVLRTDSSDNWLKFMSAGSDSALLEQDGDIAMPPNTCYLNRDSSSLQPTSFTKEVFAKLDVIAQCDKKFIVCVLADDVPLVSSQTMRHRSRLIFVDQHAAHERVLLERLQKECFSPNEKNKCVTMIRIRCVQTPSPIPIAISQEDAFLLLQYRNSMERWGIQYRLVSTENSATLSVGDTMNIISIPELMVGFNAETVQDYVKEQLLLLRDTAGGGTAVLPRMVMDLLKSRACTSAIKFGDYLDHAQCKSLITELAMCDLPFQCAHGRPSLLPIVTFSDT